MKRSVLEIFLNLNGILCITSDDFDDMEIVILNNINRTGDYYKPRCVSCNKKTNVNVIQEKPLSIWVNLHFLLLLFHACHLKLIQLAK